MLTNQKDTDGEYKSSTSSMGSRENVTNEITVVPSNTSSRADNFEQNAGVSTTLNLQEVDSEEKLAIQHDTDGEYKSSTSSMGSRENVTNEINVSASKTSSKADNFEENAVVSTSLNFQELDSDREMSDIVSCESPSMLSARTLNNSSSHLRRRQTFETDSASTTVVINEADETLKKLPHFGRRKTFNTIKYVISLVLIILDVIFDWIEYTEMNTRGTYEIVAERQVNGIRFTYECEGTGETIQYVYMIFTIVGTILSVGQICNISYQMVYEVKNTKTDRRIVHEYVETFVFLFFIEMSQILLIMGFFDVCKLNCVIASREILILINSTVSILKISWRWFSSCKCCTVYNKPFPKRQRSARMPSGRSSRANASYQRERFKCEQPCKCCILRCFPSRFEEPDTEACACICKDCLACERTCKCFLCRCFPSHLPSPKDDACECLCGQCMNCESNCRCCILRCWPSYLIPSKDDICTCRCADCMACEQPCKCFTCRCFPSHLNPKQNDIWTCRCRECLSCKLSCPCFICRCFPEQQGETDWWTCTCGECLSCECSCGCCICRVCPSSLIPPKENVCECICNECLACEKDCLCCTCRCCPEQLGEINWCECNSCRCCETNVVAPMPHSVQVSIIRQPIHSPPSLPYIPRPQHPQPRPPPPPPRPRKPLCKGCKKNCKLCCIKWKNFLVVLFLLLMILFLLVYTYLVAIQFEYVLVCSVNDTIRMENAQTLLVRNWVKLFQ